MGETGEWRMSQGITNGQFAASLKIRSKFDIKRRRGEFIGAFAPYGYNKKPGNSDALVVDDEAADIVRDIFTWYADNRVSLGAIVKKLNALGIPNPTKYKNQRGLKLKNPLGNDGLWSASSVRRILTNEVYLGRMVQGREEVVNYKIHKARKVPKEDWFIVEGTHKPIISTETFEKARQRLNQNGSAGERGGVSPLAGIVKCGECRKAASRKSSKGRAYYCCRTYREKGKQFCEPHSIREDILFRAVLEAINLQVCRIDDIESLLRRIQNAPVNFGETRCLKQRIALCEKELENETAVFDKTYYDLAKGLISEDQFVRIREICEKRQAELRGLTESLSQETKTKNPADPLLAFRLFLENKRFAELTRGLALDFLKLVYVYADKSLEIRFRFAGPHAPPLSERLGAVEGNGEQPCLFESSDGIKVRIAYAEERSIHDAFFEHFTKLS